VNVIIKCDLRSVPSAVLGPSNNNPMIRRVRPLTTYYLGRPAQMWVDALARRRPPPRLAAVPVEVETTDGWAAEGDEVAG